MFNKNYCDILFEEIENIQRSGLNMKSPNTMNRYGVILDDFGFNSFLETLMKKNISILSSILYPEWGGDGDSLNGHHGFAVEYKIGKDEKLNYHIDNCEITLNVCLCKKFEGGSLLFNGIRNHPSENIENFRFDHIPRLGILHVGQHWHSATKITKGERYNLILWIMSSKFRSSSAEVYHENCKIYKRPLDL